MARVIITGANRGIGLELVRQLKERGDSVVAVCRKSSAELGALAPAAIIEGVDVSKPADVERLADDAAIKAAPIDVLINNAGILRSESLSSLDVDSIRTQFEVNSIGPLIVTSALRPALGRLAKVVIITSRMGSIADNGSGGYYGYRMSKAAVNMAGMSLARDLKGDGISVAILHPGAVKTEMTNNSGMIEAPESARGLIARIDELSLENTGTFWHMNGEVLPW